MRKRRWLWWSLSSFVAIAAIGAIVVPSRPPRRLSEDIPLLRELVPIQSSHGLASGSSYPFGKMTGPVINDSESFHTTKPFSELTIEAHQAIKRRFKRVQVSYDKWLERYSAFATEPTKAASIFICQSPEGGLTITLTEERPATWLDQVRERFMRFFPTRISSDRRLVIAKPIRSAKP